MAAPVLDWRSLRVPGALALGALLLLLATAYGGSVWLDQKQREFRQARNELARAASQYRSASDDKQVYEEYAFRFRRLEHNGLVGAERRLSWVEALQSVNQELKLPVLRYQIEPQQREPVDGLGVDAGRFVLHRSDMRLSFGALHEGDVLRLLAALAEDGDGLMAARSCNMVRLRPNEAFDFDPGVANLEVGCDVAWYTLRIEREEGA